MQKPEYPKAKKNIELVSKTQEMYERAAQKRIIGFRHVKGHSGNAYNDIADKFADIGAEGEISKYSI